MTDDVQAGAILTIDLHAPVENWRSVAGAAPAAARRPGAERSGSQTLCA